MIQFQPEDDFLVVVDKKETLELIRPQNELILDISAAWRTSNLHRLQGSSNVAADELDWFLADTSLGGEKPQLGDTLKDSRKNCWTISELSHLDKIGCWKCHAINMVLRYGLDSWVDWYRPQWTLDSMGVPTPEYRLVLPGIPAKIQPSDQTFESELNTTVEKNLERHQKRLRPMLSTVEIFIHQPCLKIGYRDCFVTAENRGFRVLKFHPAASWKELARITAEEVPYDS